jgi:hypothetical protein
MRRFA